MQELDWIRESFGQERLVASLEFSRECLCKDIINKINCQDAEELNPSESSEIKYSIEVLELCLIEGLTSQKSKQSDDSQKRRDASELFELYRALAVAIDPFDRLKQMIKTSCFGIMGERNADVIRYLKETSFPELEESDNWGKTVLFSSSMAFLLNVRKNGWSDLERASEMIKILREQQRIYEKEYLTNFSEEPQSAALELVALYHFAKAMDILSMFFRTGDRPRKTLEDLDFHFDKVMEASGHADLIELGLLSLWTRETVHIMMKNSLWWVVGSTNPKMTNFVRQLTSKDSHKPIFELWPSQSRALVQEGLLDPAKRAVVIQMPTSGGKTLLAEFRILQTKQSYPESWIAYIVPTRALVNQITNRLREDLSPLEIKVEKAVPAFELDPLEEELLLQDDSFDVLVTTQEKLDLLIRSGKLPPEKKPIGLVILDEAHNIKNGERGLRTELLLATINREYGDVHFLLLSPFVPNIDELANWLGSERSAKISIDWKPNDQLVGLVYPKGRGRNWSLQLKPLITSRPTLQIKSELNFENSNPKNIAISRLAKRDISSVVSSILSKRSGVIVLALKKDDVNAIAEEVYDFLPFPANVPREVDWVNRYIEAECGEDFLLCKLLKKGVAFHHAGVPNDLKYLLEWLMNRGHLKVMVATTTLAQGVNFPISAIVINDYKVGRPPEPLSTDEFWNIAGRAGRADQESLGIIAFASKKADNEEIEAYVKRNISELTSHLEKIVYDVINSGAELDFNYLVKNNGEWSNFVQYLCHAYRQVGDHSKFITETETLMKATYGYQRMARENPSAAYTMVKATIEYAEKIEKIDSQVLYLMDQTGFSPTTITEMRKDVKEINIKSSDLSASGLFSKSNKYLKEIVGALIRVPELDYKTRYSQYEGTDIAEIISMWVRGESISLIAQHDMFANENADATKAVTSCTEALANFIHNTSWGLGAFESLTLKKEDIEKMDRRTGLEMRSIPAMIYFGVNTLEGVTLRNLGVPRSMAVPLGEKFRKDGKEEVPSLLAMRKWLEGLEVSAWNECAPQDSKLTGEEYQRIWKVMNGYYVSN